MVVVDLVIHSSKTHGLNNHIQTGLLRLGVSTSSLYTHLLREILNVFDEAATVNLERCVQYIPLMWLKSMREPVMVGRGFWAELKSFFSNISLVFLTLVTSWSDAHKARTKLKNVKTSDVFPSYAFASREDQRIFINENLTNYRRELFWKANKMKKDNMITSTRTMDGKIFVKTSLSGTPVRIYCVEDLDDL